jgi:hypothetical protein
MSLGAVNAASVLVNSSDQGAAGAQYPCSLGKCRSGIIQQMEQPDQHHGIHPTRLDGQACRISLDHSPRHPAAGDRGHAARPVHSQHGSADMPQPPGHDAGAACDVEHDGRIRRQQPRDGVGGSSRPCLAAS